MGSSRAKEFKPRLVEKLLVASMKAYGGATRLDLGGNGLEGNNKFDDSSKAWGN